MRTKTLAPGFVLYKKMSKTFFKTIKISGLIFFVSDFFQVSTRATHIKVPENRVALLFLLNFISMTSRFTEYFNINESLELFPTETSSSHESSEFNLSSTTVDTTSTSKSSDVQSFNAYIHEKTPVKSKLKRFLSTLKKSTQHK